MGTEKVWKSTGRLADGREVVYFDESPGLSRADTRDSRDLVPEARPASAHTSWAAEPGLRWDALLGEWVVIAAHRQDRTFFPPPDLCPLCPSRPGRPTEIPAPDYDVVVFENRFPSLRGAGHAARAGEAAQDNGFAAAYGPQAAGITTEPRPAHGRCEVVCFTADHDASFASLTPRRVRTVVEAWADRTAVLGAMRGVAQVFCFENRGEEIGVTLHHPHGQIYAFPFVTPRTTRMLAQAGEYALGGHGNLFDDHLARELSEGTRIVASNEHWTAFVPAAARWPYEVLLFPAGRVSDLPALGDAQRAAFCDLYLDVLRRLDALFATPMPYIAAWNQAPAGDAFAQEEFRLHCQLLPVRRARGKLKYQAGTESGMGVWISDVMPETAARRLREAG